MVLGPAQRVDATHVTTGGAETRVGTDVVVARLGRRTV